MVYSSLHSPARIISRQKLSDIGEHWGVQLPSGEVAHLTPDGEQIVSFSEFARGRPVKEIRRAAPEQSGGRSTSYELNHIKFGSSD